MEIRRGDIYFADLNPVIGSEQGGIRPVVILQNNVGNKYSPTTIIVAAITSVEKPMLPTHVRLNSECLTDGSTALLEQIRTVDKSRLLDFIGKVSSEEMKIIEDALLISIGIDGGIRNYERRNEKANDLSCFSRYIKKNCDVGRCRNRNTRKT